MGRHARLAIEGVGLGRSGGTLALPGASQSHHQPVADLDRTGLVKVRCQQAHALQRGLKEPIQGRCSGLARGGLAGIELNFQHNRACVARGARALFGGPPAEGGLGRQLFHRGGRVQRQVAGMGHGGPHQYIPSGQRCDPDGASHTVKPLQSALGCRGPGGNQSRNRNGTRSRFRRSGGTGVRPTAAPGDQPRGQQPSCARATGIPGEPADSAEPEKDMGRKGGTHGTIGLGEAAPATGLDRLCSRAWHVAALFRIQSRKIT